MTKRELDEFYERECIIFEIQNFIFYVHSRVFGFLTMRQCDFNIVTKGRPDKDYRHNFILFEIRICRFSLYFRVIGFWPYAMRFAMSDEEHGPTKFIDTILYYLKSD